MSTNTRTDDLLARWKQSQISGHNLTAEDICRDCPELLDELRARIAAQTQEEKATNVANPASVESAVTPNAGRPPGQPGQTPMVLEMASPPAVSQRAPTNIPGYEILAELGRGGMGVVYKARDQKLNRMVALKMILSGGHASESDLARFMTEAQAVAALHHPNIVQIYEVGQHNGLRFFTMEFVEAGSLANKVHDNPLPPKEAAAVVSQLADGIACAHGKGVVHRDLKPENVLLAAGSASDTATPRRTDYVPKITDFGLAKRFNPAEPGSHPTGLTLTGEIIGTPGYMAPEQARGAPKEIGPLTDVYSLGAILYRLLTGRPPFQAPLPWEAIEQLLRDDPVAPSSLVPRIPKDLETITLKCLRREQGERYQSAKTVADDLGRFLSGEPILARPVGRIERSVKWARRHPTFAAFVTALVAGIAISTVLTIWALGERGRAKKNATIADQKATLAEQRSTEAMLARNAARKRYFMAVVAFNDMIFGLQSLLEGHAGTQKLRIDLLAKARTGLRILLQDAEQVGTPDDTTLIWSYFRMGDVEMELGDTAAAQKEYQAGHDIARQLADADSTNLQAQADLGAGYGKLGAVELQLGIRKTPSTISRITTKSRSAEPKPTQRTLRPCAT